MKKDYYFEYGSYQSEVWLSVNFEVFTKEKAIEFLGDDCIDEKKNTDFIELALKKMAFFIIQVGAGFNYRAGDIILLFSQKKDCYPIDGTEGVELIDFRSLRLEKNELRISKIEQTNWSF